MELNYLSTTLGIVDTLLKGLTDESTKQVSALRLYGLLLEMINSCKKSDEVGMVFNILNLCKEFSKKYSLSDLDFIVENLRVIASKKMCGMPDYADYQAQIMNVFLNDTLTNEANKTSRRQ